MRPSRTVLALQVVVTCLVTTLGIWALTDGRVVVGVLLVALATARGALFVARSRRRAELRRPFGGMGRHRPG
jgi:hypothetical protein